MDSLYELPSELLLSAISSKLPGREQQIHALVTLTSTHCAPARNIILYGPEATGKSATTRAVLGQISEQYSSFHSSHGEKKNEDLFCYAIVKSDECIGARHFIEQTIRTISEALNIQPSTASLLNISDLICQIQELIESWRTKVNGYLRFVLVFDGIDRLLESLPPNFLAALARIGDIVSDLTLIFITTCPRPSALNLSGVPHIFFKPYGKAQILAITSLIKPSPTLSSHEDTVQTWGRFAAAVYDSLSKYSGRDIVSFRALCLRLWPLFIRPIMSNELAPNPFSRLMVANRSLFRNESFLVHDIIPRKETSFLTTHPQKHSDIANLLPKYSRFILIASYIASFSTAQNDAVSFIKLSAAKRRKKGGTALSFSRLGNLKSRRIPRKLLGAQVFVLERMLAIFHAIYSDSNLNDRDNNSETPQSLAAHGSADIQMGIATLVSLRLLTRVGSQSSMDVLETGTKYRVTTGQDMIKSLARNVGVEIENYLID